MSLIFFNYNTDVVKVQIERMEVNTLFVSLLIVISN